MIDLDAIRERDASAGSLLYCEPLDDGEQAQIDRRALLSHIYELTKQRAQDAEEIRRLRAQLQEWLAANGPGGWIDELRRRVPQDSPHADKP